MTTGTTRAPHPFVFALLAAPFGISSGFVGVALAYLATRSGLTVEDGAVLVSVNMVPQMLKFLWAPLADITLTRRRWYILAAVAGGLMVFLSTAVRMRPGTFLLLEALVFLMSVAASFMGFACEGILAHVVPPGQRGRYSGWYQAGYMAANGAGGGFSLWLMTHEGRTAAALALFACMLIWVPLIWLAPEVPAESRGVPVGRALALAVRDVWQAIRSRIGLLSLILCFVPVGTGAAASVLAQAQIADHWHVDAAKVAFTQGYAGGFVSLLGAFAGGYACEWLGSRTGYAVFGGLMAVTTAVMALLPATPAVYVGGALVYNFLTGSTFAGFCALALDAIGAGNAATKYNAFACISNFPIWYMGLVLAAAETRWGPRAMLLTESAAGLIGIGVFLAALLSLPQRPPAGEARTETNQAG